MIPSLPASMASDQPPRPVPVQHSDFVTDRYWQRVLDNPQKADLFSVLRWIDSRDQRMPLLGRGPRPLFEAVRLAQEPSMAFAASTIASITQPDGAARPRVTILSFGLFGPNGPLPLHVTEYARDRLRRFNDPTLTRFVDLFHHRMILLFYRAWADTQSTVSMDRAGDDRFTNYAASLIGYGQPALRARDSIPDHAKLFHAQHFARQTRSPEGLAKILSSYFSVPVSIVEFVTHWIDLTPSEQTRLSPFHGNNRLGEDAVIGARVLDAQHRIRIRIGPMPLARYRSLLPTGAANKHLASWLKNYLGLEYFVDFQLILQQADVFPLQLGGAGQLGWTSWLDSRRNELDADDLLIDCAL